MAKGARKYTEEEIQFMRENKDTMSLKEIALELGSNRSTIGRLMRAEGIIIDSFELKKRQSKDLVKHFKRSREDNKYRHAADSEKLFSGNTD